MKTNIVFYRLIRVHYFETRVIGMKKIRKITSIILAMVMLMSAIGFEAIAASGILDEVPEGYIGIYTVEDLYNVRNDLAGNYILMNDIDLTEATAPGGEYDFNGNGWNPIGSGDTYSNNAFTGVFDGNGHSIVGFRMNVENKPETLDSYNYYGLFAHNSGIIRNLTMFGSITGGFQENVKYCGGISAFNNGTIVNCVNNCNISVLGLEGEKDTYTVHCGGITGYSSGSIEECVNNGDVTNGNDSWSHYIGGITSYIGSNSSVIKNCYNTGKISGYYAGGIVANCGYTGCVFTNCYNIGEVVGTEITVQISNGGTFENCYYLENGIESTQTGVTVLTSDQMKLENNFTGFDFDSVWIIEDSGYPYPQLKNNALADVDFDAIRVKKLPDTTLISYNTELDMFGCIIELLSGEEVVGIRGVTNDMVSGYNKTKLGVQTITVSLNGISTNFDVEVKHYCDIYGHDCDWITTIIPTETTKGERIKKCLNCGKSFEIEEIPVVPVGYIGVYDPESLNSMRDYLGGNYVLLCDVDMTKATAKGSSCDFNGNGWLPVGGTETYGEKAFTGSLNGNFHKITGLRMELVNELLGGRDQGTIYVGLFSNLNGTVKNLYVEDVKVNIDLGEYSYNVTSEGTIRDPYRVVFGSVAAKTSDAKIEQVVVSGKLNSKNPGTFGGIAGSGTIEISNSINCIDFNVGVSYETSNRLYGSHSSTSISGIVCLGTKAKINRCTNFGNIYLENKYDSVWAAGITTANNFLETFDCYNVGNISTICDMQNITCGISCYGGTSTLMRCYNIGNVKKSTNGTNWSKGNTITNSLNDSYSHCKNCFGLEGVASATHGAKELTAEQMLVASNYEGFSFGDVWYFDQNDEEYPYPKLKAHIFGDNCDHSYTDWIIDSEPTCDTVGVKHQFCVLCKDVIVEETPALGHDYFDEFTIEKEGTCSESGIKYRSCSRCTDKVDITIIPPTGHDYSEWNVDVEATCTTAGSQSSTCATCGDVQTAEIAPYGHTYSTRWTTDIAPTCTEAGSKSHHCLRCGDKTDITEIPAKGHDFTDWFVDTPPTCTGTGANYRACKTCGIEELQDVSAKGHTVGEWITELEPTCTEDGLKYQLCSECDTKIYDSITPLGHNYSDSWTIDVEATCTTAGSKSHHCTRCNERSDITVINAYGHSYSENWTVDIEATCIEDGSKSHHCLRCDDKTDITSIKATGHSYSTWILDIVPTCTEKGVKYRVCESCKNTEIASMEALGHDYSDLWTADTPATCLEDGVKSHHCTRCNDKTDITKIPATGHFYGAWNVTVEPTCTAMGARSRICELCDAIEMQEMAPYGHNYSTRWTIDVEPTCLAEGSKSHHCLRCDEKKDETIIPVSGHIFGKWYIAKEATMDEPGIKAHDCYNCDLIECQEIPKLQKYTATFIADGEIVAVVDFPEDATEINEPEVPQKNRYTGKWEEYVPENKNIVIYAEYTKIDSNGLSEISTDHTADYYSSTGVVDINLFASSPSKNIIINSSKSVPLDIVLVLDQSGSMAEPYGNTKRDALVDAVNKFNASVYENAVANGVDHRIAIVGFGMGNDDYGRVGSSNYIPRYCNTNLLTAGGNPISYNDITESNYRNAFVTVNAGGTINPLLTTAVNNIDAKGATMANLGLEMAASIFANNPATDRQRVVVFLTDGVPTSGSSFEYGVANAALENAYQLKDTYNATVYSVGLFDSETTNNKNVNNFMNYVSSNYAEKKLLNSKRNETTPAPADYYMSISDTSKLSGIFTTIAEESVVQTGVFDNATIVYTVSKYFTLTSVQEEALRKSAIETLGVTNDDIVITRNADGTTAIKITNAHPTLKGSEFVIDFTFQVTANGDTRRSGTYTVNTLDSGILLPNSEEYENVFDAKTVDIIGSSGIATFTINGIPYHIERLTSSETVIAPAVSFDEDYHFSGWNVPNNYKLNNASETFDATLTRNEYSITWNIDGELIVEYYSVGDVITPPTVTFDSTGDLFACWDTDVPHTMPADNLTITALYDVHYHNYEVTKNFNSCEEGGMLHYECQCGSEYDEAIEPSNHEWHAISGPASETNNSTVGFRCEHCGAVHDNSLEFIRIQKDNGNNKGKAVYELYFKNNSSGENEQPGETVSISVPLDQCFSDVPEGMKIEVYRVNDDGSKTKLKATSDGDYLVFETDHFSTYEFVYGDEVIPNVQECHDYVDGICSICGEESVVFDATDMHIEYLTYGENTVSDIKDNLKHKDTYVKIFSIDGTLLADTDLVGTGATVEIYDSQTDSLIESYTIVLYGDVNGDGLINDADKEIIASVATFTGTIDNKWCLIAADVNHDGAVDAFDVIETDLQTLDMHNIEQKSKNDYLIKEDEE